MGLFLGDLIQFWAREGERLIIRDGCLFEGWCLLLFQLIFKMFNRTRRQKIIKTRQEMVRLKNFGLTCIIQFQHRPIFSSYFISLDSTNSGAHWEFGGSGQVLS